jgi:isoamylase
MKLLPGAPYPLGATWDGQGVNVAVYSEHATQIELCLFDESGAEQRYPLAGPSGHVWHGYVVDAGPGQRYGFRVHGPYDPERGLRFNPHVVLLDPYARAIDGTERWDAGCFAYELGGPDGDLRPVETDQLGAPRGVVIDDEFDWEGDAPLGTPLHRSVIYEAHVRGLTMRHPEVPEALRGTYAGVAHPAVIRHLRELGVTAIELMPIHAFVDDKTLVDRGVRNYWGYSTIGFFAPDVRYRAGNRVGSEVVQLKEMIKALHRAGIEVILDVVYNHTAEGNHLGPTLSFKGIDNPTYYRLVGDAPRYYFDYTGTGNTLDVRNPQVLALVMDSLRYWAVEMHVDGFRFDLASALARQLHEVDRLSSFFTLIHQAPYLRHLKLIAEPWDVGEGGYQVGNFPTRWAEWNGRYRDTVRALWAGHGPLGELGYRITGSSDLYQANGRRPSASINFVTSHDGFTLRDMVSYAHKHNEANGEGNRDGHIGEVSFNCGAEGDTSDGAVLALRRRQTRNLVATLLLSQGTPMLLAGDEMGRTQRGNNNAYCLDDETSWVDWEPDEEGRELFHLVSRLLRIRREHPALHRSKFFQGRSIPSGPSDLVWLRADGKPMAELDWKDPGARTLTMFLAGRGIDDVDEVGRPIVDDNLVLLVNPSSAPVDFTLPPASLSGEPWVLLVDTDDDRATEQALPGGVTRLAAWSLKFFRAPSRVIRRGGSLHELCSTYRLQLGPELGFARAAELVDYLADLGVTDVYLSPIVAASSGSSHGYDVTDHTRLNGDLGDRAAFDLLSDRLRERNLGLLLDWVPNHMGIRGAENPWWRDVLEHGPSSLHAETFDVDWVPPRADLEGRILLPILGDQYGDVLERGELRLARTEGSFEIRYFEHRLPVAVETSIAVLEQAAASERASSPGAEDREELASIVSALRHLPGRVRATPDEKVERARESAVARRRLAQLLARAPALEAAVDEAVEHVNGTPGDARSFDALDAMVEAQSYRLASWRVASAEINYRRFFDVNDLAAIRMEEPDVFARAHELIFQLIDEGRVQGLRLDHTDGLFDPAGYFERLQRRFTPAAPDPTVGPDDAARPLPIVVEKILQRGEKLPEAWPVDGTTGYEVGAAIAGLWVDPRAESAFGVLHRRITGDRRSWGEHVYEAKRYILRYSLASEVSMLARWLSRIAAKHRRYKDFTLTDLTTVLVETMASFSAYRTYVTGEARPGEQDVRHIAAAIGGARARAASIHASVFDFLEGILSCREGVTEQGEHLGFAQRFQQLTGPVVAKAVEDTVFYRHARLLSLNEVGGDPATFGTSSDAFHQENAERSRSWPRGMVVMATHDTKRGEDAAARISTLTEMPDAWRTAVRRWMDLAEEVRRASENEKAPGAPLTYLFFQALVGAVPFRWDARPDARLAERLDAFLLKAAREAKEETSWTNPDASAEAAIGRFASRMLARSAFREDVRRFCASLDVAAATNALAQCVLRLTVPGVADTYRGTELWNQSLVDPDNRRPVDFADLRSRLAEIEARRSEGPALARDLLARFEDGTVKLHVTHRLLALRKAERDLFLNGDYEPIASDEGVVAFSRRSADRRLLVVVPRLVLGRTRAADGFALGSAWGATKLLVPVPGAWRDVLTGASRRIDRALRLEDAFADFPVAVLISTPQ